MRFARNFNPVEANKPEGSAEHRRHGRVMCQGVECSIGDVADLSASGMRVTTRFKLPERGEVFVVTIQTMEGPLAILSRVRWSRRKGLFMREAGLEFFDVGPRTRAVLCELAGRVAYNEQYQGRSTAM
jgi:hypothetical protein